MSASRASSCLLSAPIRVNPWPAFLLLRAATRPKTILCHLLISVACLSSASVRVNLPSAVSQTRLWPAFYPQRALKSTTTRRPHARNRGSPAGADATPPMHAHLPPVRSEQRASAWPSAKTWDPSRCADAAPASLDWLSGGAFSSLGNKEPVHGTIHGDFPHRGGSRAFTGRLAVSRRKTTLLHLLQSLACFFLCSTPPHLLTFKPS